MKNRQADVLIVGEGAVGLAEQAVEAVGGRLHARAAWLDATGALDALPGRSILLVEAEDADAETLAAGLPRLAEAAIARDLPVIACFGEHQIDLVAAHLLDAHAQLLCNPSQSERIAALALAKLYAAAPPTHFGEDDAARLAQLRAEVARVADLLARLGAQEPGPADARVADREQAYGAPPGTAEPVDPQEIRRLIRARRLREKQFGRGLFEDPAWDMLLDLYAADAETRRVSVSSLCIAAAVAPTTALRWIGRMVEAGLFVRRPDPADGRRALMALSDRGRSGMAAFHAALTAAGLPLV